VVVPFPSPQPQPVARVALKKTQRPAAAMEAPTPNDLLQPVSGVTDRHATVEPPVDQPERVVLSETLMSDLSSSRPAPADTAEEFDDPSATPLPSPMPPPADSGRHPVLEVRAQPNDPMADDDLLDEAPQPRTGLKIAGIGLFVAAAGAIAVFAFTGPSKPTETPKPQPQVNAAPPAPTGPVVIPLSNAVPVANTAPPGELPAPEVKLPEPVAEVKPPPTPEVKPPEPAAEVKPPAPAPEGEGDFDALLKEGKTFYDRGQAKKALGVLEKAVALKPESDEAQVALAFCHMDRGAMGKALSAANLALATNPNNGDAYLVVGTAHQSSGKNGEARTAYKKYLELKPKGPHASDVRAILKSLE
jgi:hypothetical protein